MSEDGLLLAYLMDKMAQCEKEESVSYSYFLDSRQRMVAEQFCRSHYKNQYLFWGGYEEAERTVCFFLPWYLTKESFYQQEENDFPLALLQVRPKGDVMLSHRDYLGALMALGIKRELVGDILVLPQGADIIVFRKLLPYLEANYEKAGSASLMIQTAPLSAIAIQCQQREVMHITVASLRLDVLVTAVFHLSRGVAAEAISRGQVFINGQLCEKPEKNLQPGDKIVLRGKGKAVLTEIGRKTRKDKISVTIEKYL